MAKNGSVKERMSSKTRKKTESKNGKKINNIKCSMNSKEPSVKIYEVMGIVFIAFSLIAVCGLFNFNVGFVGLSAAKLLHYIFGVGAWLITFVSFIFGGYLILQHETPKISLRLISSVMLLSCVLAIIHHFVIVPGEEILPQSLPKAGGLVGGIILFLTRKLFGVTGGIIILGAGAMASLVGATSWSLAKGIFFSREKAAQGVDFAKDKLESTYNNFKEKESKIPVPTEDSFFDQEKDGQVDGKSNKKIIEEEQTVRHHEKEQPVIGSKKQPLPRITNEHSLIDPPDWGESSYRVDNIKSSNVDTEALTLEEENIAEEDRKLTQDVSAVQVIIKQDSDCTEVNESNSLIESLYVDSSQESLNNSIEIEEIDEINAEQEKNLPTFTIQYSRSGENVSEVASEMDNILSEEANSQLDVADRELNSIEYVSAQDNMIITSVSEDNMSKKTDTVEYIMPQVSELLKPPSKVGHEGLEAEIAENAEVLAKTLEDFKVKANIINACHGPAVTRYELTPAPGVKVSKITGLSQDLALALAAVAVRIEPIPGKAAIGVEVPNKVLESVPLCEVLQSREFTEAESPLTVGLGMDISGHAITADLGKMPHLLVAGATGSGKSVCVNTLITSILFKARPDEVKFILIDPKMVELSNYNGIPHLMVPVVTDMRKAASVLNWAVQEMEKRYAKFAAAGARDMARYNNLVEKQDKLPAVVIIIDELADLMMVAPHDVEDAIFRLAQKARAAGIHLVLATQRPSVDVITGTIKSNIPSRISFAVSSQVDSRTILDDNGAEMLLGKGDMLFLPMGSSKAQRVQGAFISDEEVETLLAFIRNQGQEMQPDQEVLSFTENVGAENAAGQDSQYDELLPKAVELVINTGGASTTNLQRRFHIGYGRAAGLIDVMEELNIVGPRNGSKPREILVTVEEARSLLGL